VDLVQLRQGAESTVHNKVLDHEQLTVDIADPGHCPDRHQLHRFDVVEQGRGIQVVNGRLKHCTPEQHTD